jgi:hypothetical protein
VICSPSSPIWGRRTTPEDSKEGRQSSLCVNGWRLISQNFSPAGVVSLFVARANIESEVTCQKSARPYDGERAKEQTSADHVTV